MTMRTISKRLTAPAVALGLIAAATTHAAPQDFSDDFNDGIIADAFLLDRDGDLMTTADAIPYPLWFVDLGSDGASNATAVRLREQRRPGELRFNSGRNRSSSSFIGYTSMDYTSTLILGTFEGWTFDPQDALDNALAFDNPFGTPTITLSDAAVDAISPMRMIGLPGGFTFSFEARLGHKNGLPTLPDPISGAFPSMGVHALLVDHSTPIGWTGAADASIINNGIQIAVENDGGLTLTLALRRYQDGGIVAEETAMLPIFESFDGQVQVSYLNNPTTMNVIIATFLERNGRLNTLSLADAFPEPATMEGPGAIITGACCFDDNTCFDNISSEVCEAGGGQFRGMGSTCGQGMCAIDNSMNDPALGACCLPDDTCMEIDAQACVQLGGLYTTDGLGCVGACTGGGGASDGSTIFLDVPRIKLHLGAYSQKPETRLNGRNTRIDNLEMTQLTFQLDGNLNRTPDPDVDGNGVIDAVDMAAALAAFPPSTDVLIEAILRGSGGPVPEDFLKNRQYFRAVGRWYKQNVLPVYAGDRTRKEKRQDRRRLKDLRFF